MDNFAKATKMKLRFETSKGALDVEDIWDLPLLSPNGVCLDNLAIQLKRACEESATESFVKKAIPNAATIANNLRFQIVKYVIEKKITAQDAAVKREETQAKKAKILAALANKQDEALTQASEEDLKKMLDDLSA